MTTERAYALAGGVLGGVMVMLAGLVAGIRWLKSS